MKIIIFAGDDIFSGILMHASVKKYRKQISKIYIEKRRMHKKNSLQLFLKVWKTSGPWYALAQGLDLIGYRLISIARNIFGKNHEGFYLDTVTNIAAKYNIQISKQLNFMQPSFIKEIKDEKPDIIFCIRFSQIIKKPLIDIPARGCINFHASILPMYAGLGTTFQTLLHREQESGGTFHLMTEKIDDGKIVEQSRFKIKDESVSRINLRGYAESSRQMLDIIDKVLKDKKYNLRSNKGGKYFTFPKKEEVRKFQAMQKKLVQCKDFLYAYKK